MTLPEKLTYHNFRKKINADQKLVVVEFFSVWNGSSFIMKQILESIQREFKGRVSFFSVDHDQNPDLIEILKIKRSPCLLFIKEGEVVNYLDGITSELVIRTIIKDNS